MKLLFSWGRGVRGAVHVCVNCISYWESQSQTSDTAWQDYSYQPQEINFLIIYYIKLSFHLNQNCQLASVLPAQSYS